MKKKIKGGVNNIMLLTMLCFFIYIPLGVYLECDEE